MVESINKRLALNYGHEVLIMISTEDFAVLLYTSMTVEEHSKLTQLKFYRNIVLDFTLFLIVLKNSLKDMNNNAINIIEIYKL